MESYGQSRRDGSQFEQKEGRVHIRDFTGEIRWLRNWPSGSMGPQRVSSAPPRKVSSGASHSITAMAVLSDPDLGGRPAFPLSPKFSFSFKAATSIRPPRGLTALPEHCKFPSFPCPLWSKESTLTNVCECLLCTRTVLSTFRSVWPRGGLFLETIPFPGCHTPLSCVSSCIPALRRCLLPCSSAKRGQPPGIHPWSQISLHLLPRLLRPHPLIFVEILLPLTSPGQSMLLSCWLVPSHRCILFCDICYLCLQFNIPQIQPMSLPPIPHHLPPAPFCVFPILAHGELNQQNPIF